jgi:biopolymer transport protein TolR
MAFGRLQRDPGAKPMSDINMTPLIDVMLVLLVIFIVTAPLISSRLPLALPQVQGTTAEPSAAVLEVSVDAQGQLFLGQDRASRDSLAARARAAAERDPLTEVQLRADEKVPYGRVAELIGLMQQAGLTRIGFVTETAAAPRPDSNAAPGGAAPPQR